MKSDTTLSFNPVILSDLFLLGQHPERLSWQPFRPGVEIHRLYGDAQQGPSAALLKYEPGAKVPAHSHTGYEHIIVLSGSQRDYQGNHTAGTLVINPPDSSHDVASDEGCIVLIIWEKPVVLKKV
ncbi:cupin domain-containing protein [Leptolyngbya ectocarpi]|uniref:cupin domain-containing protein n=1 Tax=Leptolyngbya ectocarpi TaxID=1202 RepID=UPI001D15221F|nr:cupin domain-containing protein [Leptolyngbya ectocarpi]